MRYVFVIVTALAVLGSADALAQEAIVIADAPIFIKPDTSRVPLRTAARETRLRVLDEQPEGWVRVEFDDPQIGRRVGYIETRFVKIVRPELEPMNLSIKKESASSVPAEQPASSPRRFARGWIDVNFGIAAAGEKRHGSVFEAPMFDETATFAVDYRSPLGAAFDFGGGVMLTPFFGLGITFAGTAHQDTATLGIRIPHPRFFNAHATDSTTTEGTFMRSEGSANIQAMFVSQLSDRLTARFYGGPSFFRVRQDAVTDILYNQEFLLFSPVNRVAILEYETAVIPYEDATGWGFHVGGDVNYFFTRVVGIGGFARFSRGTVDVAFDPFAEAPGELKTGGFQTGGGLRLRF